MGLAEAATVTLTGNSGLTDTGYGMQDAGLLIAQVSLEVRVHQTWSLLEGI